MVLTSSAPAIPLRRRLTRLPGIIEITPNQSVLTPYDVSMTVTDWIMVVVVALALIGAVAGGALHYRQHGPELDPDDFRHDTGGV